MVLVAAALLLARSFARLLDVDAGFNPSHVLTLRTSLPSHDLHERRRDGARLRRGRAAAARIAGRAGRPAASPDCRSPRTRGDWGIRIEGQPAPTASANTAADWQVVTPGYFEAIGTPLRAGRTITDADTADTLPVIVVNETMAKKYWPGVSPIGRRMMMGGNGVWLTVVGVVADVHHRGLDVLPRPEMYRPHTQFRYGGARRAGRVRP